MSERSVATHRATVLDGVQTRCTVGARWFDLALTLLILPLAIPLAALVAIAVVLDSPGPVLFRSPRVGRDGRLFRMVKFRTMRHQETGPRVSCQDDRRYTPIGRLLSASRLDELPQLWNVLCGQMRLAGPRPEVEEFVRDQAESYRRILSVPPGITGPTQLRFADEGRLLAGTADPEQVYRRDLLPQKVRLDCDYVRRGSRSGDFLLLLLSLAVPFRQVARSLTSKRRGSPTRGAGLVLARAATLAGVVMTMVALFAVEGASAQAAPPPASDPDITSPAGGIYAVPLDAARRDAAPRRARRARPGELGRRPSRRGTGSPAGRSRGGTGSVRGHTTSRASGDRASASAIRSENNFGSSSRVPGVDGRPAGPGSGGSEGATAGGSGSNRGSGTARLADRSLTPVAALSAESDGSGPSLWLVIALVGSLVVGGVVAGTLAGRARRS